ncbi:MAG: NADH-quinone oxidoreductase subunit C [Actinomycetota bacterium]|nr:NADH-quinone oxidoreductase subunit C [Actinomycetota bacterium]
MTAPLDVPGRVRALLGSDVLLGDAYGEDVVDVPPERWVEAVTAVRDDADLAMVLFDVLTAVDEEDAGFAVVLRLWSPERRAALQLRTRCSREDAQVPSLSGVFAGAGWHERSVREMFGVDFAGHPALVPLLLPAGFAGHPLRKDFVLASRAAQQWPGAPEPGESAVDAAGARPSRRRPVPPGVPAPGTWPAAPEEEA